MPLVYMVVPVPIVKYKISPLDIVKSPGDVRVLVKVAAVSGVPTVPVDIAVDVPNLYSFGAVIDIFEAIYTVISPLMGAVVNTRPLVTDSSWSAYVDSITQK